MCRSSPCPPPAAWPAVQRSLEAARQLRPAQRASATVSPSCRCGRWLAASSRGVTGWPSRCKALLCSLGKRLDRMNSCVALLAVSGRCCAGEAVPCSQACLSVARGGGSGPWLSRLQPAPSECRSCPPRASRPNPRGHPNRRGAVGAASAAHTPGPSAGSASGASGTSGLMPILLMSTPAGVW